MSADSGGWASTGQTEIQGRARQLFEQMLGSRPAEADWTLLRRYLTLLADLRDYAILHQEEEPGPGEEPVEEETDPFQTDNPSLPGQETYVGTFHEGLRGGTVVTEDGPPIPVPEKISVAAGFRHGDVLKATYADVFPDGRVKFAFERLCGSGGGNNPARVEALGFVEQYQQGGWFVRTNGLEVQIPDFEMEENGAALGDVVTVAYMEPEVRNRSATGVIVRVHESDLPDPVFVQPQRPRRQDSPGSSCQEPSVQFEGHPRVVIVGGRNWPFYREGVTQLGGEPVHHDGFAMDRSLDGSVAGADIVVVIKSYCSHSHYDKAKAIARENGRLFYSTSRENWSGLLRVFEQEIVPAWNARASVAAD